jgi:hypothetical protein
MLSHVIPWMLPYCWLSLVDNFTCFNHVWNLQCFNEHLPEHNKFCGTERISSDPKGKGLDLHKGLIKKIALKEEEKPKCPEPQKEQEAKKPKEAKKKKKVTKKKKAEEQQAEKKVEEIQSPEPESLPEALSTSHSEFVRGTPRQIERRETFVQESVDLRHAELLKREYGWMTPEWINAQLRKTPQGRKLLEQGELATAPSDIEALILKGLITWEKPEWAKSVKLRPTQRGEQIKKEAEQLNKKEVADV